MKIAIISDLHSNIEALHACLDKARALDVDKYVCLGDMIGYGPDPATTLDMVMKLPGAVVIRGNHEEALFSKYYNGLRQHIRETVDWTKSQLSEKQLKFLESLPYQEELEGVTMVHASANQPDRWPYIYNSDLASKCMQAAKTRITFIGHTHQPAVFFETPGKQIKCIAPEPEVVIPLYQHSRYVINVGSVGQPRDENNAASFAIYDSTSREVVFYRMAYDYVSTGKKIVERGLPKLFAERLVRGH